MKEKEIDLQQCRSQIDKIDKQMAELFETRMHVVSSVAEYKAKHGLNTYDPKRESEIKSRNKCYVSVELQEYYAEFFDGVLYLSKKYQNDLRKKEHQVDNISQPEIEK